MAESHNRSEQEFLELIRQYDEILSMDNEELIKLFKQWKVIDKKEFIIMFKEYRKLKSEASKLSIDETNYHINKKRRRKLNLSKFEMRLATFMLLLSTVLFFYFIPFKDTYSQKYSAQNNTDISTSISLDKAIIWFLGGAFGYAAIYVVGKSISDKDE